MGLAFSILSIGIKLNSNAQSHLHKIKNNAKAMLTRVKKS
jgi:hypothetical protein